MLLVIGGGITGLSYAYDHPDSIIIENKKLGGRVNQIYFDNKLVPSGAGIGRWPKDKKLWNLMKKLNIKTYFFDTKIDYYKVDTNIDILKTIEFLKTKKIKHDNFKDFFVAHLGHETFEKFVNKVGYSDYLKLNPYDALYNYGFEDTCTDYKKFYVAWNEIISKLSHQNIIYGDIKYIDKHKVIVNDQEIYYDTLKICIPPADILKSPIYDILSPKLKDYVSHIHGQSFCYVYAKIKNFPFKTYTVVPPPFQKIIPFGDDIYMLAYCDNDNAEVMKNKTRKQLEKLCEHTLNIKIKIEKFKIIYWKNGTHYRTTKYMKTRLLKGEAYALNQGWTNGGL